MLSKKPYRGTRDFFPASQRVREYLFKIMKEVADSFAYEPYDGPLLEEVALYQAKSGEELINEQIYSFTDRGDRFVAIRPEMTPTLARMIAQVHKEEVRPIRWFSIPNLMRYEKPQRGRLREHWQFNCDIFGASSQMGELEILNMAIALFKRFGANEEQFEIRINDRAIVDALLSKLNLNEQQQYKLYKIIDKAKKVDAKGMDKMISELGLEAEQEHIIKKYLSIKNLDELNNLSTLIDNNQVIDHFLNFIALTDQKYITYDPCIVRGLDYYTGIVFEIFDKNPENRRALCGGGSYANLLQIFDEPPLAGVGFGLGDVTLKDFLEGHKLLPAEITLPKVDLLLTFQDEQALKDTLLLATKLREQGISVQSVFEKIKVQKVFKLAPKKGAQFISLIGSDEIAAKTIQLKNLNTKEQREFSLDAVDKMVTFMGQANHE